MEEKKENVSITKKGVARKVVGVIFLLLFAAVTVLSIVYYDKIYGEAAWCKTNPTGIALFDAILSVLPNILGTAQALFVALLLNFLVTPLTSLIFRGTSRRITVGKLIRSILSVVIWIGAVIAVLAVWGVNVAALVAGAGVLTLIIGLGMQSLIADVVAGIFLVCDGLLEVGDVVTIDGWRGTVQEIGIRNTTLINYSGDIRVCNNSTIKVFVNQSRAISMPTTTVSVAYREDVKKIEKLFEENREEIMRRIPEMTALPVFLGVDNLNESGVDLLFGANCEEENFFVVKRALNRELKALFDANGVEIPFPQVVVHESKE